MASTGCSRKTCFNAIQTDYLYENHSAENGNNWLEIKLAGTTSNRSAIGAKVRVTANQCLTLVEGQAPTSATQPPYSGPESRTLALQPNPSSDSVRVVWEQPQSESIVLQVSRPVNKACQPNKILTHRAEPRL